MKKCPKCGCNQFLVTAHVTQDWEVDGNADFIKAVNDCVDVTHKPDDEDLWECNNCGYAAAGKEFNVEEKNA